MGTYNPHFQNNVPEKVCPHCGKSYPLDWFGQELKHEIRDKRTGHVTRITTLTDPTRLYGNELLGGTELPGVFADDLLG